MPSLYFDDPRVKRFIFRGVIYLIYFYLSHLLLQIKKKKKKNLSHLLFLFYFMLFYFIIC